MSDTPAQQPARKLTKREKKALEFRAKKKGKAVAPSFEDEVAEIEERENGDLGAEEEAQVKSKGDKGSKKRKREEEEEAKEAGAAGEGEEEQPKKKKRQRGKTKAQRDREAREAAANGEGGEGHHRLLLFVGNMPYTITVDEIKKHFEPCGEVPTIRLLTPKNASLDSTSKPTSKGCAFLEFTSATALQSALRLHHSTLSSRKINVELTAGGGGNSATRRAKIEEQRKKLNTEREKAAKNKRLKEGESEDGNKTGRWKLAAEKQKEGGEGGEGAAEASGDSKGTKGGKKVRDRRLKPGAQKDEAAKQKKAKAWALKASTGANAIKLASGWGNKAK
ncbi:hypothetical protein JCM10296v2_003151 [Rhodotorula toruloides]